MPLNPILILYLYPVLIAQQHIDNPASMLESIILENIRAVCYRNGLRIPKKKEVKTITTLTENINPHYIRTLVGVKRAAKRRAAMAEYQAKLNKLGN